MRTAEKNRWHFLKKQEKRAKKRQNNKKSRIIKRIEITQNLRSP